MTLGAIITEIERTVKKRAYSVIHHKNPSSCITHSVTTWLTHACTYRGEPLVIPSRDST